MFLYIVYDPVSYNSFVACCETEFQARYTHPLGEDVTFNHTTLEWVEHDDGDEYTYEFNTWVDPKSDFSQLRVSRIGTADPGILRGGLIVSYSDD